MSDSVKKIKERLTISDVISSYIKLEKSGVNYKAVCPFHSEKSPSFFVSPARESYYCFGCGAKGDVFTFVEQFEGLDFKGALKVLALRAGVELEPWSRESNEKKSENDRLYELMEVATAFYEKSFQGNQEAKAYIEKRGVSDATRALFRVGYAPLPATAGWRMLVTELRAKGFTDAEILRAGLAKHPDDNPNGEIYDRFRDRVMFPISDTGGRVIAFSGRLLHDDGSGMQGKYINSPETPIFKKGSTLYGLDKAKFEIRRRDLVILVEGQMDLVLSHQAGFTNTVAASGTALSDSIIADEEKGLLSGLGQIRGLTKNIVLAFDADKAGLRAAGRAEKIGLSLGMNVKVAKLPKGLDPADVIQTKGAESWKDIISSAQHIILCYLAVLAEHPLSSHARAVAIRDKILPYVAVMPSAVERAHFVKEIEKSTGISESALLEDISKMITTDKTPAPTSPEIAIAKISRSSLILDRLLGILFWQETLPTPSIDVANLKSRFEAIVGKERFEGLYGVTDSIKNEKIFEAELLYNDPEKLAIDIEELLDNLEEETLSKELEGIMNEVALVERGEDNEKQNSLLKRLQEITKRISTIKSSRFIS